MAEAPIRTLTVAATSGLCNRLCVLLSGMALAEAAGRRFTMLWPRTPACSAAFADLFTTPWPVIEVPESEVEALHRAGRPGLATVDLLASDAADLRVWSNRFLFAPDRYPAHKPLVQRSADVLATLQPTDELQARITAFQQDAFRPRMIGVHLRRADLQFFNLVATTNTPSALAAVDACLARYPDAGILLCTDDGAVHPYNGRPLPVEGVRARFQQRYGDRVVSTTPRSLDRRDPIAIQDALVDVWLLRRADCLVGTAGSSFSILAAFGRPVPVTLCQSQHPLRLLAPVRCWLKGQFSLRWLARYYWKAIRAERRD